MNEIFPTMRLFVSLAILTIATLVPFGANARTMQISDARSIVDVTDPKISPDGSQIVCVVTRSDYAHATTSKRRSGLPAAIVSRSSRAPEAVIRRKTSSSSCR